MAKKIAVIDLGTNTFNLLIAEVKSTSYSVLHHDKIGVALGMGGINKGIIAAEAITRAMEAIRLFKIKCDEYQVNGIKAFGTSALRDASNKEEFSRLVQDELGIEIAIISGEDEAQLIYQGVKWSYDFTEPVVIMDIGGGSTEFIHANQAGIIQALSLNIGVSRIYQQLQLNDPLSAQDVIAITQWLENNSKGKLDHITCDTLIGSSGTFETLYELLHEKQFPKTKESIEMSVVELRHILEKILKSTLAERQKNPFIIPIRQYMIPIAAVKILWILEKFEVRKLVISPGSLKEGALKL